MLEEYLDLITSLENYVDGMIVCDKNANIIYMKQFRPDFTPLDEKRAVGMNLFDIYPDMTPETSTIWKALKKGTVTLNYDTVLYPTVGRPFRTVDNTYPIKEDGEIIGAICITTFPESDSGTKTLELYSNMPEPENHLYLVTDIIGRSPQMQTVRSQIERVARTNSSVLIYGATGTGKELAAQSIHTSSPRRHRPFISQNCAAIPATLLESLFFGTTKGSFTGAVDKAGIFENASGGTVFLDEINSMDINLQAKLLRVLEEKSVTRVGGTKQIPVDVRIIAATNKDPASCMRDGDLRADLFYRLSSVTIDLPLLKDRQDDIELLTEYFISEFNNKMHRDIIGVSQDVLRIFKTYSWPGNVREFRNVIEGAFNLCEGTIISGPDLPAYILSSLDLDELLPKDDTFEKKIQWLGSLKKTMDAYEKTLIADAVKKNASLTEAAKYLGISRQSLNQKLNKYDLKQK